MKRIVMTLLALALIGGTTEVSAQAWLKKLGDKAKEAAKRKVEQKVEEKTEKAVDDVFEGNIGKDKKSKKAKNSEATEDESEEDENTAQSEKKQKKQSAEMTYAKSDFVAGDEIFFEDNQANEQLGEFPSQWDMESGNAEIMQIGGDKCIALLGYTIITPLIGDGKNYFPEQFTLEFDIYPQYYYGDNKKASSSFEVGFYDNRTFVARFYNARTEGSYLSASWVKPNGDGGSAGSDDNEQYLTFNEWHHVAISFNKRALKFYVDGVRLLNIPNMKQPTGFWMWSNDNESYFKNFRLAKGAVPLYDRMMSDGKFITYGITFDVGKSTIKPESMGEINRIVQLMNENPDLKFSVEGHTDSTGKADSNQTLSEARSQAIVDKLVELGIAKDRLTAVGKGQNNPIADNSTDEGRAKNRRVEFVKQ